MTLWGAGAGRGGSAGNAATASHRRTQLLADAEQVADLLVPQHADDLELRISRGTSRQAVVFDSATISYLIRTAQKDEFSCMT